MCKAQVETVLRNIGVYVPGLGCDRLPLYCSKVYARRLKKSSSATVEYAANIMESGKIVPYMIVGFDFDLDIDDLDAQLPPPS